MQQRISELAQQVTKVLRATGLRPITDETIALGGFGVTEHSEPLNPMVTVTWHVSYELSDTAMELMEADPRRPVLGHMGVALDTMSKAMLGILRSAGLDARMSVDDLSPGVIEVFG